MSASAREPGELVCLDTFYIGQLPRRRQDLADYGLRCGLLVRSGLAAAAHTAEAAAHFLRRVLLPVYRRVNT